MTLHDLKTWPNVFDAVRRGEKPWEFRCDDRSFRIDDAVILREWLPEHGAYSGATIGAKIGYILHGPAFGIPEGFAIFTLKDVHPRAA